MGNNISNILRGSGTRNIIRSLVLHIFFVEIRIYCFSFLVIYMFFAVLPVYMFWGDLYIYICFCLFELFMFRFSICASKCLNVSFHLYISVFLLHSMGGF